MECWKKSSVESRQELRMAMEEAGVLWRGCGGQLLNINRVAFKGIIPCRLLPF